MATGTSSVAAFMERAAGWGIDSRRDQRLEREKREVTVDSRRRQHEVEDEVVYISFNGNRHLAFNRPIAFNRYSPLLWASATQRL